MTQAQFRALPLEERRNVLAACHRARRLRAQRARVDPSVFNEFVLRDELTGKRIQQAPMHQRWHDLISAHPRLVLWSHVEGGKTNQIAIGRVLWELGRNPNLRVVIISKTNDLAMKIVRAIAQYIEKSDELHEVFPGLMKTRNPALPWNMTKLTVERPTAAKDASIQACGVGGNILGSRIDLLILDDAVDQLNTMTHAPRERVWNFVRGTLMGRLTDGARVVVVGNAWHPEDLLHRLEKEPRFIGFRFPVMASDGTLTWPERWSHQRIDNARLDMGPLEFARALLCQARDDETARIKREWIDKCVALGAGLDLHHSLGSLLEELGMDPETAYAAEAVRRFGLEADAAHFGGVINQIGLRLFTGVDLAVSRADSADKTALFTIALFPNGTRRVLEVLSGRWSSPEIRDKIIDAYVRFGSTLVVENNAAQQYIVDMIHEKSAAPVIPFTTGSNKAHHENGVEHLGVELSNGKWIIPSGQNAQQVGAEVSEWIRELYHYDPRAHTGDRLMASWFAREGARMGAARPSGGSVGVKIFEV